MLAWMLVSPALNVAPAAVRSLHHRMAPPAMQMQNDNQAYQSGIMPYTGYNGVNPASGSMSSMMQGRYSQYPSNDYYNQPMYDQGPYQGQYQQQYGFNQQRRDGQYSMGGMGGGYGNYYGGGRYQQQYGFNQQRRGMQYGMGNGYGDGGYGGYGGGYYGGGYNNQMNYLPGYNQYPSQYGRGYNNYYDYDDYDDYGRQYPSRYGLAPSAEPEPSSPRTRTRALRPLSLLAPDRKRKAASYPHTAARLPPPTPPPPPLAGPQPARRQPDGWQGRQPARRRARRGVTPRAGPLVVQLRLVQPRAVPAAVRRHARPPPSPHTTRALLLALAQPQTLTLTLTLIEARP